jgi:hypothetical protein
MRACSSTPLDPDCGLRTIRTFRLEDLLNYPQRREPPYILSLLTTIPGGAPQYPVERHSSH